MTMNFPKLVIGTSMAIGVSVLATAPAHAGTLTGATIGGTAANDYLVYDSNATSTFLVQSNQANVQKVLDGNAVKPTGNVELRASTEQSTFSASDFTKNTTLSGTIGGKTLTLSSLTSSDWFGTSSGLNIKYGANTLATKWFNDFLTKAGKGALVGSSDAENAFNLFGTLKGFQRTSDPNISYVNQDDVTGDIKIGLAGHYDLKAYYASNPLFSSLVALLPDGFQASEVVKYTYNSETNYLYSFFATASELTNSAGKGADGKSHSGNYEVTIKDPKAVPEPSVILGLLGVVGIFATQRQLKKASC